MSKQPAADTHRSLPDIANTDLLWPVQGISPDNAPPYAGGGVSVLVSHGNRANRPILWRQTMGDPI